MIVIGFLIFRQIGKDAEVSRERAIHEGVNDKILSDYDDGKISVEERDKKLANEKDRHLETLNL